MTVNISDVNEVAGWREVLLVLAVDRWQVLLADLGVPVQMAGSPERLHAAASRCWQINLALQGIPSQGREDYRLMMEVMLRDFFIQVASDYSDALAVELYHWALRQYVNDQERNAYLLWGQVLRRLADVAGLGYPLAPTPFPAEAIEHMKRSVESHLSLELQHGDAVRVEALSRASASAVERQLADRGSALPESVQASLLEALTSQRAYQVLAEILKGMDSAGRQEFLDWARWQATMMGMPAHLVTLPAS